MLTHILNLRLDAMAFALASAGLMATVMLWLRRKHGVDALHGRSPILLGLMIIVGIATAEITGRHEQGRLRAMLEGLAPTYAQEVQRLGHASLSSETPENDPVYVSLIEAQKRWERVNPAVNDIYTFRTIGDQVVLVVDAETDYDRNGFFEGDREERTSIGEPYDESTPEMLRCLSEGVSIFDDAPVSDRWGTWVSAYAPLRDADGNIEGALGVDYDARSWTQSILAHRFAALSLTFVMVIILVFSRATVRIAWAELQRRIEIQKQKDELQQQLLKAHRAAGMAEVAAGVLHNVGNVLNSVNVSTHAIAEQVKKSKIPAVARAAALMQQSVAMQPAMFDHDPKGRQLPHYLEQLAGVLCTEQSNMLGELDSLSRSVDHIKQIVASQQTYAKQAEVIETVDISRLIADALRITGLSPAPQGIELVTELNDCRTLRANQHRVLQILVNLLSNARKAVSHQDIKTRRITIRLNAADAEGRPMVSIEVIDSGIGISAEQLPRIFQHGYTTSAEGHGFGLHASANDARQLGGSIRVASDGHLRGARFTLELPIGEEEVCLS